MAETKTKTKAKTKVELEEENSALKKQLDELEELKKQLQSLMAEKQNNVSTVMTTVPTHKVDRMITFVNMTNGTIVLKGSQIWTLDGRYTSRSFSEKEAQIIVNNMMNFVREGYVYITDAEFVEENGLTDAYRDILSDTELKSLLDKDVSYVSEVYKMVTDGQKDIIISMVTDRKMNNEYVDANILVELGKLSGKNLMEIEPLED